MAIKGKWAEPPVEISPEIIDAANALLSLGKSWRSIAATLGVSDHAIRRRVDPEWNERQNTRRRVARVFGEVVDGCPVARAKPVEVRARLAEIPEDTRDMTGRLMGDPLPGRSALDRERMEKANG